MRRGYTPAQRWVVTLESGGLVFVKIAPTPEAAQWLRNELVFYRNIASDALPEFLGFDEDDAPMLVLEDLSHDFWPPPWTAARIDEVIHGLETFSGFREVAKGLPSLESEREAFSGW